jgi:FRG domain
VNFSVKTIRTWKKFNEFVLDDPFVNRHSKGDPRNTWLYRGQKKGIWKLQTTLERAMSHWDVPLANAQEIEAQMVRDFRRKYKGNELNRVESDIFYCLALMQHHGAPTRLLDCTYSPFVAARFAIDIDGEHPVIWRFRAQWCEDQAKRKVGSHLIDNRSRDKSRDDSTFKRTYMRNSPKRFVLGENPFPLNERIILQQGIFLCPGDITASFEDNLRHMDGWESKTNVMKIKLKMTSVELKHFANVLRQMNVNADVLFPGLDGFARSFGERIYYFDDLAKRGIGGC